MARLLTVLVFVTGLMLVGAPANADVAVTIKAGKTTLLVGDSTTVSGKAVDAKPGSVVKLQRKISGAWTTLKEKKVWSTKTYSFTTRPPKGYQYLRVVKPRQLGQPRAVSPVVKLTVRWHPNLTASAESLNDPVEGQLIRVTGSVTNGPANPVVAFERKDTDGWGVLETRDVQPGVEFTFEAHAEPGPEYRVRLLPTTLTTRQVSSAFLHTYTPYVMELDSDLLIENLQPTTGVTATVNLDIPAGDWVTIYAVSGGVQFAGTVTSPSGQRVASFSRYDKNIARFEAPETGTYTIDIADWERSGGLRLWASTPKVVTTTIDAPAITVSSDLPGQPVDVRFDTTEVPMFTVPSGASTGDTVSVVNPTRAVEEPFLPAVHRYREAVYRSAGGTYTFRIEPTAQVRNVSVRPLSVTRLTAAVNGPNVDAVVDVPDRVVVVEFERPEERVTVGYPTDELVDVGVFDATTGAASPTGPGTSVVAVSSYDDRPLTLPLQLTTPLHFDTTVNGDPVAVDLTGSYRREIALHFHATAGQVIREDASEAADSRGSWGGSTLTYAGGTAPNYLPITGGLWRIPADGDYTLTLSAYGDLVGTLGVKTSDSLAVPGDGTPTTVNIDEPGEVIVATVSMPVGTVVDATLDNLSASLGDTWDVTLITPDNSYWYNSWAQPGQLPAFTVREPGDIVALISAEQTGSLRLTFAPRT